MSNPSKMRIDLRFYADLISVGVFTLKVGRQLQLKNVVGRVAETSFLVKNLLHSDHKNVARHYVVRYSFIFLFFFSQDGLPLLGQVLTFLVSSDKEAHTLVALILAFCKHCGDDYAGGSASR